MEVKKKKSAIFWSVCIVGVIVLIFTGLYACGTKRTYEEAFKVNWGFDLPSNMERIFYGSTMVLGEGVKYVVCKLEEEPTDFIVDFSKERDDEFEIAVNNRINYATKTSSEKFEIPLNLLPNWEIEYYWKLVGKDIIPNREPIRYYNNLYIIYFPDSLMFIFCEFIT